MSSLLTHAWQAQLRTSLTLCRMVVPSSQCNVIILVRTRCGVQQEMPHSPLQSKSDTDSRLLQLPSSTFFVRLSPMHVVPVRGSVLIQLLHNLNLEGHVSLVVTLVSWSKTLNHCKTINHCFVLRMGRKAVGPMCCVKHIKEPSALIEKRRGSPRCSWLWLLYAP